MLAFPLSSLILEHIKCTNVIMEKKYNARLWTNFTTYNRRYNEHEFDKDVDERNLRLDGPQELVFFFLGLESAVTEFRGGVNKLNIEGLKMRAFDNSDDALP